MCQTVNDKGKLTKKCVNPTSCKPGCSGKKNEKCTYCCNSYMCNVPGTEVYYGKYK